MILVTEDSCPKAATAAAGSECIVNFYQEQCKELNLQRRLKYLWPLETRVSIRIEMSLQRIHLEIDLNFNPKNNNIDLAAVHK